MEESELLVCAFKFIGLHGFRDTNNISTRPATFAKAAPVVDDEDDEEESNMGKMPPSESDSEP